MTQDANDDSKTMLIGVAAGVVHIAIVEAILFALGIKQHWFLPLLLALAVASPVAFTLVCRPPTERSLEAMRRWSSGYFVAGLFGVGMLVASLVRWALIR